MHFTTSKMIYDLYWKYRRICMLWHFKKMPKNMQKIFIDTEIFIVTYAKHTSLKEYTPKYYYYVFKWPHWEKKSSIRECFDILSKAIIFSCQFLAYVESFCRPFLRTFFVPLVKKRAKLSQENSLLLYPPALNARRCDSGDSHTYN